MQSAVDAITLVKGFLDRTLVGYERLDSGCSIDLAIRPALFGWSRTHSPFLNWPHTGLLSLLPFVLIVGLL